MAVAEISCSFGVVGKTEIMDEHEQTGVLKISDLPLQYFPVDRQVWSNIIKPQIDGKAPHKSQSFVAEVCWKPNNRPAERLNCRGQCIAGGCIPIDWTVTAGAGGREHSACKLSNCR